MKIIFMKKRLLAVMIILMATMFLASSTPVSAKKLVFEDDFSSGTLTNWYTTREHPEYWAVNQVGAAQATINRGSTIVELVPTDEHWNANWKNIEWDFDMIAIDGLDKNFSFNYQNLDNWYEIHFIGSQFQLAKVKDGRVIWSVFKPFNIVNNKTYHLKLTLRGAVIKLDIDGQLVADEVDPTFDHNYGKIGIKATTGSVYPTVLAFDNIRVYDLDQEEETDVTFKQTDAAWANEEYDHAQKWAQNPTIKHWGCALTAMAMVLRHYQINQLPPTSQSTDRCEITPSSLNQWLKSQSDGYLNGGLLNWIAITRLTRLINTLDNSVKLEYQHLNVTDSQQPYLQAVPELRENRWTIASLPNHFVTVHGMNETENDLKIYDPFNQKNWLSQYIQENKVPQAYKKFVPSHTDLSYLLFAFDSSLSVKVFDENNTDITDNFIYTEHINDALDTQAEKSLNVIAIPKPKTGKYKIRVKAQQLFKTDLTIFAYDQTANLSDLSQPQLIAGTTPLEFNIDYQKEAKSSLTPIRETIPQLKTTIDQLTQTDKLPWTVNFWLQTYLDAANNNDDEQLQTSYQVLLDKLISWFRDDLDNLTYQYLKQQIKTLW